MLNSRKTRFQAFYCLPGIEGAHEKGGVEGQVGYFRRNYLVPVPEVGSLAELNESRRLVTYLRPPQRTSCADKGTNDCCGALYPGIVDAWAYDQARHFPSA